MDEEGKVVCTDENLALLAGVTTTNANWGETEADLPAYLVYEQTFAEMDFSEVGIFALSDTELVYVIDAPLSGFYLKYQLPSGYLVHIPTYDACETVADGVYTNTYGTTAETILSYGPYVMTSFQMDKEITYAKNELYFDLTEDTYQTTNINIQCVPEATTRLEMFLQGKLDSYGLTKEDMDTYSLSDHTYYSVGDSTFAMTFNPGLEALQTAQETAGENINKTILTLVEFRMAMSLAMDRDNFCLATSPLNSAAFGLFSSNIISDPEAGVAYRSTDTAKMALAKFWGVSEDYGEGKLYADIDEAIDSITGYNLELAKQKFNEAYDLAIEQGLMDEDDIIQITVGIPNASASFYKNGYEFIVNNYTNAVVGTKLENKLTFNYDDTIGNSFADALQKNQVNMLFGVGWTGSQLDPYGLMQVYVDPNYQYDSNFDLSAINLTVVINGEELTTSVANWYYIMQGEKVVVHKADETTIEYSCGPADNDPAARLEILGAMEQAILMNYNFIPLMDDAGANLKGMQIKYFVEEYVPLMGFGGLKNYTYNYTDAEWDAYVQAQGGELDYT
jgi:ABC-type transport system substrate-binding protein